MLEDLKTIKKLVSKILREEPKTRDNDMILIFKAWEMQGFKIPDEIAEKIINYAASPESIRRMRQKIQEAGFYRGLHYDNRKREEAKIKSWAKDTPDYEYFI